MTTWKTIYRRLGRYVPARSLGRYSLSLGFGGYVAWAMDQLLLEKIFGPVRGAGPLVGGLHVAILGVGAYLAFCFFNFLLHTVFVGYQELEQLRRAHNGLVVAKQRVVSRRMTPLVSRGLALLAFLSLFLPDVERLPSGELLLGQVGVLVTGIMAGWTVRDGLVRWYEGAFKFSFSSGWQRFVQVQYGLAILILIVTTLLAVATSAPHVLLIALSVGLMLHRTIDQSAEKGSWSLGAWGPVGRIVSNRDLSPAAVDGLGGRADSGSPIAERSLELDLWVKQAREAFNRGDLPAIRACQAMAPRSGRLLYILTRYLHDRGDCSEALELLDDYVEARRVEGLDKHSPYVLINQALCLKSLGRRGESLKALDLVIESHSCSRAFALRALFNLLDQGPSAAGAAFNDLKRAEDLLAAYPKAWETEVAYESALLCDIRGYALYKVGALAEAEQILYRCFREAPWYSWPAFHLGLLHYRSGQFSRAVLFFGEARRREALNDRQRGRCAQLANEYLRRIELEQSYPQPMPA